MTNNRVVIVSADSKLRASLAAHAAQGGFDAETADSLQSWLTASSHESVHCLVLDMPASALVRVDETALFAAACASRQVLALTAAGDVPTAVQAIRQGATDVMHRSAAHRSILDRINQMLAARS
ncbi:MAG: hypothetical protein H6987_18855 [Pseudomonadales bacterium]|nr:hypothetical protein [Pseudomonadales bacterium]